MSETAQVTITSKILRPTPSSTQKEEDVPGSTLHVIIHNVHHMRLEFPPPPDYIIPTTIWNNVVQRLRLLGLKFVYGNGNIEESRLYDFERDQSYSHIVKHNDYEMSSESYRSSKEEGVQELYSKAPDPILGDVNHVGDEMVQQELDGLIMEKGPEIINKGRATTSTVLVDRVTETSNQLNQLDNENYIKFAMLISVILFSVCFMRRFCSVSRNVKFNQARDTSSNPTLQDHAPLSRKRSRKCR
ncbi:17475_t:CDS:1 [Funneliformis caledonium]|uniref:17475_t:CDS:1 n=1 Tax=Funneliformis caledonium TaxID=1117310 RepID=A0A9N8ZNN1_9GLOM|nr:17475_t:CDS:1 [Funneliformis caledonium]